MGLRPLPSRLRPSCTSWPPVGIVVVQPDPDDVRSPGTGPPEGAKGLNTPSAMTDTRVSHDDLPRRIDSDRLMLRPWRSEDLTSLHEALTESVDHLRPWIPWATPHAPSVEQAHTRLSAWMEEFQSDTNFIYAAFDRSGTHLVGGLGLYGRVGPGALEIGYWIRRRSAGAGLATEGAQALTGIGFRLPGILRIEIHLDPTNTASRRVPEKLGYTLVPHGSLEEGQDGASRPLTVFALTRSDFMAARRP